MISRTISDRQFLLYQSQFEGKDCKDEVKKGKTQNEFNSDYTWGKGSCDEVEVDMEKWLQSTEPSHNLFQELKDFIKDNKARLNPEKYKKYTFIPEVLMNAILVCLSNDQSLMAEAEKGFKAEEPSKTIQFMKFEILEEYIKNNKFSLKKEWDNGIQKEYNSIVRQNLLPQSLNRCFKLALIEMQNDLTFENIKQIKQIINANS